MKLSLRQTIVLSALTIFWTLGRQVAAGDYVITQLALPENAFIPSAINDLGQVAGGAVAPATGTLAALFQGAALSDLSPSISARNSNAVDINNNGLIVGYATRADESTYGFLYDHGTATELGTFGGPNSYALAINSSNEVVGAASINDPMGHAFLYRDGVMTDLGTLGGQTSAATAINDHGQIAGFSSTADATEGVHAFLYTAGHMTDLGSLGTAYAWVQSINDAGQIVGYSPTAADNLAHAFIYANGMMTELDAPANLASFAMSINNAGQIVGYTGDFRACLFDAAGGPSTDLNDLIPADSGWSLDVAFDINDQGQIVGTGYYNDEPAAFLLTPTDSSLLPEPATLLLASPLLLLNPRRRRKL